MDIAIDDYRLLLEDALATLREPSPDIAGVSATLRAVEPVVVDGTTVTPDLTDIVADLEANPPRIADAIARIESLLSTLDAARNDVAFDEAGDRLRESLARDEFTEEPVEDRPSLSERIWGWVGDGLRWLFGPLQRLLDRLSGTSGGGQASIFDYVVALLGVVLVVGIVFLAIRAVRGAAGEKVVGAGSESRERTLSSAAARDDADRLAAEGNYRAALRARYLATLLRLEEAGRLRFDRSLTNREVLVYTVQHGDGVLRDQLAPLVERFDLVWYGQATCSADDYARFAELADHVGDRALAQTAQAA
jgi:hypothetical protein